MAYKWHVEALGQPGTAMRPFWVYVDEDSGLPDNARAALERHGYPDLRANGMSGSDPSDVFDGWGPGDTRQRLRRHVCFLDGIEIDGHEGSDLDPASTACIHCDYEGPHP